MPNWAAAMALGFLVTMVVIAIFDLPILVAVLIGAAAGGIVYADEPERR
jgi:hypothetical protein